MSQTRPARLRNVVVLGASNKPNRYSNKAVRMLKRDGYRVLPVHPRFPEVEGVPVFASLDQVHVPVDTLTLYLSPPRLAPLIEAIVALKPGRVIFNPGTESMPLAQRLEEAGIPYHYACTLVMLQSKQF